MWKVVAILLVGYLACADELKESPREMRDPLNRIQLSPTLAIVVPSELVLSSTRYDVSYSDRFLGLSSFHLGLSKSVTRWENLELFATGRMGYGVNQGSYQLNHHSRITTGTVELHWIPIQIGSRLEYAINGFPFVRPSFTASVGGHWLVQTGDLPDGNDSFWIPYLAITPALTFFNGIQDHDWFGGFTFGISYLHSVASPQAVQSLSYELSGHILF